MQGVLKIMRGQWKSSRTFWLISFIFFLISNKLVLLKALIAPKYIGSIQEKALSYKAKKK
jgi:hypothetical protein